MAGVIDFVRFKYANTPRHTSLMDTLRSLAARYTVFALGQIGENEEFQEFLDEGGDFVDFWRIVWKSNNLYIQRC